MGIRLFFVIVSEANYTNFLLHPENSECICGPSQVKPKVGSFIIKWIRNHERNAPVSMVFIQKNILRCRNDGRDENLMKLQCKAPHITMIQQNNSFPPRDRRCSIMSIIGSAVISSTLVFPPTHSERQEIPYSV